VVACVAIGILLLCKNITATITLQKYRLCTDKEDKLIQEDKNPSFPALESDLQNKFQSYDIRYLRYNGLLPFINHPDIFGQG
jgi:hypothetical protein